MNAAKEKDITVASVVNAVGSLIARTTKLGVYCNAGRENALLVPRHSLPRSISRFDCTLVP